MYAHETTLGDKKYAYYRLKLVAQRHLEQKVKDSLFRARNRDEDRPAIGAKTNAKNNSDRGDCIRWITEGQCSFGEACAFKHDPNKKGKKKGRPRSPSPTRSPHRNSKGDGKGSDDASAKDRPKICGKSPSRKANGSVNQRSSCHVVMGTRLFTSVQLGYHVEVRCGAVYLNTTTSEFSWPEQSADRCGAVVLWCDCVNWSTSERLTMLILQQVTQMLHHISMLQCDVAQAVRGLHPSCPPRSKFLPTRGGKIGRAATW